MVNYDNEFNELLNFYKTKLGFSNLIVHRFWFDILAPLIAITLYVITYVCFKPKGANFLIFFSIWGILLITYRFTFIHFTKRKVRNELKIETSKESWRMNITMINIRNHERSLLTDYLRSKNLYTKSSIKIFTNDLRILSESYKKSFPSLPSIFTTLTIAMITILLNYLITDNPLQTNVKFETAYGAVLTIIILIAAGVSMLKIAFGEMIKYLINCNYYKYGRFSELMEEVYLTILDDKEEVMSNHVKKTRFRDFICKWLGRAKI